MFSCPADAHSPKRRDVLEAMAAGMAWIGELAVLGWIMVYSRALVKPDVPTRFCAVENSFWKSA